MEFSLENSGYLVYMIFQNVLLEMKGKMKLKSFIQLVRYKYLSQRMSASWFSDVLWFHPRSELLRIDCCNIDYIKRSRTVLEKYSELLLVSRQKSLNLTRERKYYVQ